MDNALIMDVSGAWVRRPGVSSVEQMNALADKRERLFLARHPGNPDGPPDSSPDTGVLTDRDMQRQDVSLRQTQSRNQAHKAVDG